MAKTDKAGIYVDAQHLFEAIYKAQFLMPKKDRCVIAPRMLDHCERLMAEFSLAYNLEDEKILHIGRMMAEYEMLKLNCRFAIDMLLIRDAQTVREIREYMVRISEGIMKWRTYVVSVKDK